MEVLNRDCFEGDKGRRTYDAACGYSEVDGVGAFNGGIVSPVRVHMPVGQWYFRFVSRSAPHGAKIAGAWWIDYETLHAIWSRWKAVGPNPNARRLAGSGPAASTFREWLALTYEWNSIQELVIAQLRARLDAWSGVARIAEGRHVFDSRAFGYAPHLSKLFGVRQLFVPDLKMHRQRAFPAPQIRPFADVEQIGAGKPF